MALEIQQKLLDALAPLAANTAIEDVRIGLGYTAILLDNGQAGVAWTPPSRGGTCSHLHFAGSMAGRPAAEFLGYLVHEQPLFRTLGVATANALLAAKPAPGISTEDVLDLLAVADGERVAMVGFFGPLVARLKKSNCHLDIIEMDRSRAGTLSPEEGRAALASCDVAILTGTSLMTGTTDELLSSLGSPREAVLLGPSAPFCPEVFADTPLTQVSGARVLDPEGVLRVVSQGGGTPFMKPFMAFESLRLRD